MVGIQPIKDIFGNKNRMLILKTLEKDEPLTISEMQKRLNLNYKTIWEHIKLLEKASLVILKQEEKKSGKPVFITLKYPELIKNLDKYQKEMENWKQ